MRDKKGRFNSKPRPSKRTGKNIVCAICDTSFYVPKNRIDKAVCCSRSCSGKLKMQDPKARERIIVANTGRKPWNKGKKLPQYSGENHPQWKGGRQVHKDGYILIYAPDHPNNSKGYVMEHRLVTEKHIGRLLGENEHIHHKNGIKDDNRVSNLEILSNSQHLKLEWQNIDQNNMSNSKKTWFKKGQTPWNKSI